MACNTAVLEKKIRTYSEAVEAVTTLDLLRAVEMTVDNLVCEQKVLRAFLGMACDSLEYLKSCDHRASLDADDVAAESLEEVEKGLRDLYADFRDRMRAARKDDRLNGHHEDAVVGEYQRTLELLETLHDATTELRWALMEHDADLDEVTGEFDDANELIAYLDKR